MRRGVPYRYRSIKRRCVKRVRGGYNKQERVLVAARKKDKVTVRGFKAHTHDTAQVLYLLAGVFNIPANQT